MLFAVSLAIAIAGLHYHVLGAMVAPLQNHHGWSRGDIAFALTISSTIHPFTNIAIGAVADRFAARSIAIPGIVLFASGLAGLGLAGGEIWTWYLAYAVFSLASAGMSSVLFTRLIVKHFTARRGLALAVSLAGSGVLVSAVPSIVLALERLGGVESVYPLLALLSLFLLLAPCWLFLPRDAPQAVTAPLSEQTASRAELLRSLTLWKLGTAFLMIAACVGTFIVHFQPMLADAGIDRETAAKVALTIGPAMIIGRLGTGFLYDRLPSISVTVLAFSLPGIACLWLLFGPLDPASAAILAILIGLGMGSEVDALAYLTSRYFAFATYGLAFGILISIYGSAVGIASWLAGRFYDVSGSYDGVLGVLALGVGIAIALAISLGKPLPRAS